MSYILVTGGAGFIGSHIVEKLIGLGHEVTVIDNLSTGKLSNLDAVQNKITFIQGDLLNMSLVDNAINGIDYVFHTSANVSVNRSIETPMWSFQQNVVATIGLLNASQRTGVRRVVFSSSAATYGFSGTLPLTESHPKNPTSPYGLDKATIEQYLLMYASLFELDTVSLRYFNVYGPRQNADSPHPGGVTIVVNQIKESGRSQVIGDGRQTRDMIYIEDVIDANIAAMNVTSRLNGVSINVCTGKSIVVAEMHEKIARLMGKDSVRENIPCPDGNIVDSRGDPCFAEEKIGFVAQTSLDVGLRKTIEWLE